MLIVCQLLLLWFLMSETLTNEDMVDAFKTYPVNMETTLARFLCAIFLHISLVDETMQGFKLMKYANNHHWKFRSWASAYGIGLIQMLVVVVVEVVNLAVLQTNQTIMDIIMNFLALVIIADFDDYFFFTVTSTPMGRLVKDGEIELPPKQGEDEGRTRTINEILKIEVTTS